MCASLLETGIYSSDCDMRQYDHKTVTLINSKNKIEIWSFKLPEYGNKHEIVLRKIFSIICLVRGENKVATFVEPELIESRIGPSTEIYKENSQFFSIEVVKLKLCSLNSLQMIKYLPYEKVDEGCFEYKQKEANKVISNLGNRNNEGKSDT